MTTAAPRREPIKRSTLASAVTERLRELVIQGSYEPGTQLSEVDLAERFAVSRGPIREGLQRLVQEGLLRSEPHRGVFVPVVSDEDISDIYLAREAIEAAALRVLLEDAANRTRITALLKKIVKQMEEAATAGRWTQVADLDTRFHTHVVESTGSARLIRMYASLMDETRACLSMTATYPSRKDLVSEHRKLAALLEAGDQTALLESLSSHFSESVRTLRLHRRRPAAEAEKS